MNRRSFLSSMLAACVAPAIVRAESIMRVKPVLLPGIDFGPDVVDGFVPCDGREIRAPALREALFPIFPIGTVLHFSKPRVAQRLLEIELRMWDGAQWLPFSGVDDRSVPG